jgi:hypothetical protein
MGNDAEKLAPRSTKAYRAHSSEWMKSGMALLRKVSCCLSGIYTRTCKREPEHHLHQLLTALLSPVSSLLSIATMSLARAILVTVQAVSNGLACTPPNPTPPNARYHTEELFILQIAPLVFKVRRP